MKFKSTVEIFKRKLILVTVYSKRKLLLTKSSVISNVLMSLVLPKVTEIPELLKDSVLENYQEKHIEVWEKLVVLELGIHPKSSGLLQELVNTGSIIELNKIKEFTELEKETNKTMQAPNSTWQRNKLLQWEVSPTTERSKTISLFWKVVASEPRKDL